MPTGAVLVEGYPIKITFQSNPTIELWAKEVTPPEIDGGGGHSTTTSENLKHKTKSPGFLVGTNGTPATIAYATALYTRVLNSMVNVNDLITYTFADGTGIRVWGWLDKFTPGSVKENEQPTATIKIEISNKNASGVETGAAAF